MKHIYSFSLFTFHLSFCLLFACCSAGVKEEGERVAYTYDEGGIRCEISAEQPAASLRLAVGEWLDEELGGYYTGDAEDISALVAFYGKAHCDTLAENRRIRNEDFEEGEEIEMEFDARMEKGYETPEFVTYVLSTYTDLGGAHPVSSESGATFRKRDGRRLSWDIVRSYYRYELNGILKEMLQDCPNMEDAEEIPLPQTPPYFLENGIVAIYQQYEIAPYAYGMPGDTLSYGRMKPLLTGWAQRLIPE